MDVRDHYSFEDGIGEGGFGKVVRATHKRTGITRAIKLIPRRDNADEVRNEIHALVELDHPNIVKLVEYFQDEQYFYLVQQFCAGPDLANLLEKARAARAEGGARSSPLPERDVAVIMRDSLKSVAGCHAHGFVHRDIKLENFMVSGYDRIVKMIDFGLSERCTPSHELTEVLGTHLYRAPEMVIAKWRRSSRPGEPEGEHGYGKAVDVWGLGAMFFALLTGESLFKLSFNAKAVQDRLADPKYVQDRLRHCPALRGCTDEARDLLSRMLRHDPKERITTADALQHPFVVRHWSEALEGKQPAEVAEGPSARQVDRMLAERISAFASMPRLQKMARVAVAHRISEQVEGGREVLTLKRAFRRLDRDGDGRLQLAELQILEEGSHATLDDMRAILRACDLNGSGAVNFVEFVACCLPPALLSEQICTEAFGILQRGFDGELDAGALRRNGAVHSDEEGEAIIREAAVAVHGAEGATHEGRITFEDFHRLLRGAEVVGAAPAAPSAGEGCLSVAPPGQVIGALQGGMAQGGMAESIPRTTIAFTANAGFASAAAVEGSTQPPPLAPPLPFCHFP
eukprot:CAMPEP_0204513942 /NCGR_PEP_ID=MMETSP0661-20131031/1774_1 /ASSEMBLY_ACC=CAM_ASM_000606 /TAXON_ID=109239 /ORGANISM="Alexandrium margalefi, Strain AMGDE01CS-322" /LENGTH=571 /DNA_ID=CAMNT_0051519139 /DNA_START=1 /DNA_END=1712 /DNA_ORIENTATION=+